MRRASSSLICALLVASAAPALAADRVPARRDEVGPRNALSLHPLSLAAHGLALQYERYVWPKRWSLVLGTGFRSSSRADYSSWVTTVGVEPRFWLQVPARSRKLGARAMVGPFAGLRADVSWLVMDDTQRDAWVGGNVGLSFVGSFGWRFVNDRFELSPSAGLGTRTDFDVAGRLAPWTRAVARLDLTAGYLF